MLKNDKIFYIIQALILKAELPFFDGLRPFLYRPFFRKLGLGVRISPGVHFKYPSDIEIGKNSYIGRHSIIVGAGGLVIGQDALLGAGTKICTSRHVTDDLSTPIYLQGIKNSAIRIGDNVWTGFDCKILQGVKIGSNSIVATNSVLLENSTFPDYAIIAGTPAIKKGLRHD